MHEQTIIVTGGAGFIGSNFVIYMLNKYPNYKIINLDSLTYAGNLENLKSIEESANHFFIKGDICDRELIDEIFMTHKPNYLINFAAESHVDRSIKNPGVFLDTNIKGTQVLLDISKKYWLDSPYQGDYKYLQVSTDEVYGSLGETGYFEEETPLAPNSPYSASKASADLFVRAYHETFGLNVNITRCSNNYGPFQFPEKLIPLMITKVLNGEKLPVYGDGLNVRDWLYVEDHCKAIDLVLQKGLSGEVYNVGGHNEKTNIEIVELILQQLGKSADQIQYVSDRLGHDRRYAIDASKIKNELGWEPIIKFEDGIKTTIDWYLQNEEWLDNISTQKYQTYGFKQ
ncbi:dTDP-glucose 4,6-dehydratase [Paenibacillus sp. RRE4]|uniref:dTDP-glucose 4,6-dehydratase n=1 Tax=Paenibacillus sp. RRE4 TaxID=2962587 RepID=UPI00288233DC|nr:dTDP-glucose 4,6-dehydratase [Paenibacillus sp. RRE4]MDT0126578.1 dTDP-glucose 4,6-dehydratase [Paenibacillus sp. RRE4]